MSWVIGFQHPGSLPPYLVLSELWLSRDLPVFDGNLPPRGRISIIEDIPDLGLVKPLLSEEIF